MGKIIFIGLAIVYILAVTVVSNGSPAGELPNRVHMHVLIPDRPDAPPVKGAPPFPYQKRDEVPGLFFVGHPCEGVSRMDGEEWIVFASSTKAMYIHRTPAGPADFVYLSVDQGNTISIKASMTVEAAKIKYPSPCDYFTESGV